MKPLKFLFIMSVLAWSGAVHTNPLSTALTYQGKWTDQGAPAGGTSDREFTLSGSTADGSETAS